MIASLLSKLPAPRPADWGWGMTICAAALCDDAKAIATITDMKVSFGSFSSAEKGAIKLDWLSAGWAALVAGDDVEHAGTILERTREILGRKIERKTASQVAKALAAAFDEKVQAQIERKIFSRFGLTRKTFLDSGREKLKGTLYHRLVEGIASTKIKLKFLVVGFDRQKEGHILLVDGEDSPTSFNKPGFWAIGDGAATAINQLCFHVDNHAFVPPHSTVNETVYFLCSAKFMAEASTSVGRETLIAIIRSEHNSDIIEATSINRMRETWKVKGAPRRSQEMIDDIPNIIRPPSYFIKD
jgi:hypothetical protein